MGHKISVSICVKTRVNTAKMKHALRANGIYPESGDLCRIGSFSYLNNRSYDFGISVEKVETLMQTLMDLDPAPGIGPNLVFFDDLEMRAWGYRLILGSAIPYEAVMRRQKSPPNDQTIPEVKL